MYKKIILFIILLLTAIFFVSPQQALAANPTGYMVYTAGSCTNVTGWTCDPDNPNSQLQIDFYDYIVPSSPVYIGTAYTSYNWAGVDGVCGGSGAHNYGFTFPVPNSFKDGNSHTLIGWAISVNSSGVRDNLNNYSLVPWPSGSNIISCAPPPPPAPTNLSAACPSPGTTANLSWAAASGATSYNIFTSTTGHTYNWSTCNAPNTCTPSIVGTSYGLGGRTAGTSYQWYVASCNSSGCTNAATGPNYTCTIPNCNATPSCGGWSTPPANSCATNNSTRTCTYTAYSLGGACNQTSYTESSTIPNCSANYSCVSGSCVAIPSAPTALSASCPSPGTTANLSWSGNNTTTTYYEVYIDNSANAWGTYSTGNDSATQVNAPTNTLSSTTFVNATYTWWMRACSSGGCSSVIYAPSSFSCTPFPTPTPIPTSTPIPTPIPTAIPTPIQADINCPYNPANPIRMSSGLLSTTANSGEAKLKFSTTDVCITDSRASIPQFSIPSYLEMKAIYYDKSKSSKMPITSENDIHIPAQQQKLFSIPGDLTLTKDINIPNISAVAVIFVGGNLNINEDQIVTGSNSGLVFVVSGNVNVAPAVTEIDAIIITYGTFCSTLPSGDTTCPISAVTAPQLTINGSVISLDASKPPKFVRSLANNTSAAEIINYQPKYLVILKNIFSRTLSIWKEIQ